jgi:hypothetical protein
MEGVTAETLDLAADPNTSHPSQAKPKRKPKAKKSHPKEERMAKPKKTKGDGKQTIVLDADVVTMVRKLQGEMQAKSGQRVTMADALTAAIKGRK